MIRNLLIPPGPLVAEVDVRYWISNMTDVLITFSRKNRDFENLPIMTEVMRRGIDESNRLLKRLDEVRYEMANKANLFSYVENAGPPGDKPLVPPGAAAFRPVPRDEFLAILDKARDLQGQIRRVDDANMDESDRIWGLPAGRPEAGPPGAEGRGMPHMRRGEYWHAGVNRR
jgi:hypothetical protein